MSVEAPAANERCARCGGPFHCGANAPEPCACTGLKLDAATLARLRQQYAGCLCLPCLAAEHAAAESAAQPPASRAASPGRCGAA